MYRLREVQRLSHEGASLVGIERILDLEKQVELLHSKVEELQQRNETLLQALGSSDRVFAAGLTGGSCRHAGGSAT